MATTAQRRLAEQTALYTLAQQLNRATEARDALEAAVAQIAALVDMRTVWVFLRDDGGEFRLVARQELPPALNYPGPAWHGGCECQELCFGGKLQRGAQAVRCTRLRSAVGDKRSLAQHMSVPILTGDDLLGIINVAANEFTTFTPSQTQALAAVGQFVGTALARIKLHDQLNFRRVQEQRGLLQLSQDLLGAEALEPALHRLVRVGARLLGAEACAFVEADEERGHARLLASHGWTFVGAVTTPVLDAQNPHLWYLPERSADLPADALSDLPPLLRAQGFHGHLATSVTIGAVPVGTLLVNDRRGRRYDDDDAQLLDLLASLLAQTLERERLQKDALARERLEQELDLARDIQTSFLPQSDPELVGYRVGAFYQAARQVGGDFYDFIPLPEPQCVGLAIADVTDKGVPAALFMALSRTLLRATASDGRSPQQVMERTNRLLLADARSGLFVTAFYAVLDTGAHTLTYASGGHNYPLWYRAATSDVAQLEAQGLVLGVMPEPCFTEHQIALGPGDVLCFYTDGVTEAMDARRQMFDESRLAEVLRRSHHLPPAQIISRIAEAVTNFTAGAPPG